MKITDKELTQAMQNLLKGFQQTTPKSATQCSTCKNMVPWTMTCKAYPNGIPREILSGEMKHNSPYNQENEIIYEAIPRTE